MRNKLICGLSYGTNAQVIYSQCCEVFGWDKSLTGQFGNQKKLYGHRAANNGTADVWFICHSNCYGDTLVPDKNGVLHHRNYIRADADGRVLTIEEYHKDAAFDKMSYPLRDRITFVKDKRRNYVFVGTYRAKDAVSRNPERSFYRVGDDYTVR